MSDLTRLEEAWPRLADGLFDFLADIDVPTETLADLDAAITATRLLAEASDLWYCQSHQATSWSSNGCWMEAMGPDACRLVPARLVIVEAGARV